MNHILYPAHPRPESVVICFKFIIFALRITSQCVYRIDIHNNTVIGGIKKRSLKLERFYFLEKNSNLNIISDIFYPLEIILLEINSAISEQFKLDGIWKWRTFLRTFK